MRLLEEITQGSGEHNEDGCGHIMQNDEVIAAWIFDGVTGINGQNYMPAATDAMWIVQQANKHLLQIAGKNIPLPKLLAQLAMRLELDWLAASKDASFPEDFDPPGACLILVKKYDDGWHGLRLGDSLIFTQNGAMEVHAVPHSDLNNLEEHLRREARARRKAGVVDFKALLKEFHKEHLASRRAKNTPAGISILVAGPQTLAMPQYLALGWPQHIILCTDGYYRAVDTYKMHNDESLFAASATNGGAKKVLQDIRAIEAADRNCEKFMRFKPADDATVVVLSKP